MRSSCCEFSKEPRDAIILTRSVVCASARPASPHDRRLASLRVGSPLLGGRAGAAGKSARQRPSASASRSGRRGAIQQA
eukprot:scaffold103465_cov38-Tisochrysis_lutea.AAC.2